MLKLAAENITNPIIPNLTNLSGQEFFSRLISRAIALGFILGVVIFIFMFIMGAIQWITSGGDKAGIESARGRITNALVGMIVLLSLYAIITLIENFFNINIKELNLGPLKL